MRPGATVLRLGLPCALAAWAQPAQVAPGAPAAPPVLPLEANSSLFPNARRLVAQYFDTERHAKELQQANSDAERDQASMQWFTETILKQLRTMEGFALNRTANGSIAQQFHACFSNVGIMGPPEYNKSLSLKEAFSQDSSLALRLTQSRLWQLHEAQVQTARLRRDLAGCEARCPLPAPAAALGAASAPAAAPGAAPGGGPAAAPGAAPAGADAATAAAPPPAAPPPAAALLARGRGRAAAVGSGTWVPPDAPHPIFEAPVHEIREANKEGAVRLAASRVMQAMNGVVLKRFPRIADDVNLVREALADCLAVANATRLSDELQEKMATDASVAVKVASGAAKRMQDASAVRDQVQADLRACRRRCASPGEQVAELSHRLREAAKMRRLAHLYGAQEPG